MSLPLSLSPVTGLIALTASIAHEVNQPLSGIMINASTCLSMLASDPPNLDGARETVLRTLRDANRATDVISRLRALFAKERIAAEPLDLNDVAGETIERLGSDLRGRRVTLRRHFAPNLPRVTADRVQIQQVIHNLLTNAVEAMDGIERGERIIPQHREQRKRGREFRDPSPLAWPVGSEQMNDGGGGDAPVVLLRCAA